MNARLWVLTSIACLLAGSWACGQTIDDSRIDALVKKLGSSAYPQRAQAFKELDAFGPPILAALRKAEKTADVETARRVAELIRKFEEQLLTKQVLAPKEVHLKLKDATVQQAIAELSAISGYLVQFLGDATKFTDKRITLDTGKTSFWNAADRLCKEANLMERVDLTPLQTSPGYSGKGKGGMRRIYPAQAQPVQAGPILLTNREGEKSLVNVHGSLKTELRVSRDADTKDYIVTFIVSAEPGMLNNGISAAPTLDKIVDKANRTLARAEAPKPAAKPSDDPEFINPDDLVQPLQRFTQVRLKGAEAREILELAGKLTYQLDMQNELLARVENALGAAGKSAATRNGGTLKILNVRKQEASILVDVALENTVANPFGNNVVINGGGVIIRGNVNFRGGIVIGPNGVRMNGGDGTHKDLPDLLDVRGQKFKVAGVTNESLNLVNSSTTRLATIEFVPNPGQEEPRDLVLFGARTHTLALPFRFENVPLP